MTITNALLYADELQKRIQEHLESWGLSWKLDYLNIESDSQLWLYGFVSGISYATGVYRGYVNNYQFHTGEFDLPEAIAWDARVHHWLVTTGRINETL